MLRYHFAEYIFCCRKPSWPFMFVKGNMFLFPYWFCFLFLKHYSWEERSLCFPLFISIKIQLLSKILFYPWLLKGIPKTRSAQPFQQVCQMSGLQQVFGLDLVGELTHVLATFGATCPFGSRPPHSASSSWSMRPCYPAPKALFGSRSLAMGKQWQH